MLECLKGRGLKGDLGIVGNVLKWMDGKKSNHMGEKKIWSN
jgi:hypothetical protein